MGTSYENFNICNLMMNSIKSRCGDSPHDIFSVIESELHCLMLENMINVDAKSNTLSKNKILHTFYDSFFSKITITKVIDYKNTGILIRLTANIRSDDWSGEWVYKIGVTCRMLSSTSTYSKKQFDDIIVDGFLTGTSEPVKPLKYRKILNPIHVCLSRIDSIISTVTSIESKIFKLEKIILGGSIRRDILLRNIANSMREIQWKIGSFIHDNYDTLYIKSEEEAIRVVNSVLFKNNISHKKEILAALDIKLSLTQPHIYKKLLELKKLIQQQQQQ